MSVKKLNPLFLILSKSHKSVLFLQKFTLNDRNELKASLLRKLKKSTHSGDQEFLKRYQEELVKRKSISTPDDSNNESEELENTGVSSLPTVIQRIRQPQNIRGTLSRAAGPFEYFQADVADLNFTNPGATGPKFALLVVDPFTQKIFTYAMKSKDALPKKLEMFYQDIEKERLLYSKLDILNNGIVSRKKGYLKVIIIQTDE